MYRKSRAKFSCTVTDQPAVDSEGRVYLGDRWAYGYGYAYFLAKSKPDLAYQSTDSYRLFALAMWLNEIDWATAFGHKSGVPSTLLDGVEELEAIFNLSAGGKSCQSIEFEDCLNLIRM